MPEPERSAISDEEATTASTETRLQTFKPRMQKGARLPKVDPTISDVKVVERVRIDVNDPDEPEEQLTIRERLRRNRKPLSSALASFLFHGSILLILLLLAANWRKATQLVPGVSAEFTEAVELEQSDVETVQPVNVEMSKPEKSPIENISTDTATDAESSADTEVPSVTPIDVPVETPTVSDAVISSARVVATHAGGGLQGRDPKARAALAAEHGGSAASEAAVEKALEWIIRHQYDDGGWRLQFHDGPCDGQCGDEGLMESPTSATSLALLSLMGAGYTSERGPYQDQVAAGIDFLLGRIRTTSFGGSFREGEKGMYAQALAAMTLSEAFSMTGRSDLVGPINDAVRYIEKAQHGRGGWRYEPGFPGDMLVTGWQVMALKSAQLAGFQVDQKVLNKADSFIDSLEVTQAGLYRYGPEREGGEPASTAVGMLMKMYGGLRRDDPNLREGALYLSDYEPSPSNIYFNYYATLVLHHRRGSYWKKWNPKMRDYLIRVQQRDGHEAGSWHFNDRLGTGRQGGRLYSTAMAAMTLEVYYRFLPLYGYDPIESEEKVSADTLDAEP